ncbi:MAG: cytidylyltransferase, partial [Gammaproteobacteria bacterium]|nr:cytidylyltransferase [Gammaproteobacteria bacterium]
DVESYLKTEGKKIIQVLYDTRTSSTKIKQNTIAQSHRRNYIGQAVA